MPSRYVHPLSDKTYWDEQRAGALNAHVRPVNELVDSLRRSDTGEVRAVPYVPPAHGGFGAPVLSVLSDPGPKAAGPDSTGFISIYNPDPTAALQLKLFAEEARLDASEVMPWNAYPWYINHKPTATQLRAGASVLAEVVNRMLPTLKVVFLQGRSAQSAWKRAMQLLPELGNGGFTVVESYHPGQQATRHQDPSVVASRRATRVASYRRVGELVRAGQTAERPSGAPTSDTSSSVERRRVPAAHLANFGWHERPEDPRANEPDADQVLFSAEGRRLLIVCSDGIHQRDEAHGRILRVMGSADDVFVIAVCGEITAEFMAPERATALLRLNYLLMRPGGEIAASGPDSNLLSAPGSAD